ncbi:MAG: glycosyltransferase family 4 protein [Acidobacteriia bacterium]|nr:glycosyltransferase family 4 protein [Terriglobia bacterium]
MKIALDATYSVGWNLSGVGVYSREILIGLAAAHPEARFLPCYRPHRLLRSFRDPLPGNCSRRLLWKGWAGAADLFHGLNQRIDSTRYRRNVSTFHDLFVMSGDYSTPEFRRRFSEQARAAAERSDLIITVSHFTARQVEQLLKVEPSRIRVVQHGVRRPGELASVASRERMVLFVGALQRRKNVARLVEAFEQVAPGWQLVLAGSLGFGSEEILARIEASPRRADIRAPGYVSDAELERLYQRASVFAFPSLDEGFGMPLLDAMAHGVPVLTSNVSALPEVSGDAALLVDPTGLGSIVEGLRQLTEDANVRQQLAQRGLARSGEFSWEKAVEKTWKVYQELGG